MLLLNSFPNKLWFLCVCRTSLLKTVGKRSNFSFSHNVFYPFGEHSAIVIKFDIVVCSLSVRKSLKFLVWKRVKIVNTLVMITVIMNSIKHQKFGHILLESTYRRQIEFGSIDDFFFLRVEKSGKRWKMLVIFSYSDAEPNRSVGSVENRRLLVQSPAQPIFFSEDW